MAFGPAPAAVRPIDGLRWTLKRYFFISVGVSTASLVLAVALGLVVLTIAYATATASSTRASTFAGFSSHVSSGAVDPSMSAELTEDVVEPVAALAAPIEPLVINAPDPVGDVEITFYDCKEQGFCGAMYNGRRVYQGAAACSWNLLIGTRFVIQGDPTRRVYVCEDRGLLTDTWVDIFWDDPHDGRLWQSAVGRRGTIEIVGIP